MLERKARMAVDHMRGMTAEAVAVATLRALEKGQAEVTLTLSARLIVLFTRFLPRFVDWMIRRKVRSLFKEEIAARKAGQALPPAPVSAEDQQPLTPTSAS